MSHAFIKSIRIFGGHARPGRLVPARRLAKLVSLCMLPLFGTLPLLLALTMSRPVHAGEVQYKNGLRISGKPVPLKGLTTAAIRKVAVDVNGFPVLMLDTGMQRYFTAGRQAQSIDKSEVLTPFETFNLPQRPTSRKLMLQTLGTTVASEFDEYGRRTVTVQTPRGPLSIVQGITRIDPKQTTLIGLTHVWEHNILTTSIPPALLDKMIRRVSRPDNPDDRLSIARFYIQAEMYVVAGAELAAIRRQFPDLKSNIEQLETDLRSLLGKQLLAELRRRKQAGQHQLAYESARQIPTQNISAEVLRDVRELVSEHEKAREQLDRALILLGELQSQLKDPKQAERLALPRSVISESLNFDSLPRLDAFLKLSGDNGLQAEEKLALAYSGWVAGSPNAVTEFDLAVRMWDARFLMLEYLRTEQPDRRQALLLQLRQIEGVSPRVIGQMIPLLPPSLETSGLQTGRPLPVEVWGDTEAASTSGAEKTRAKYTVVLPPEYTPNRAYPLIVALRSVDQTAEGQLAFWTGYGPVPGQAQRHGYIVIVPEYVDGQRREYDYDVQSHDAVLSAMTDACRRFHVDCDRIFLAGHGTGGDAAFDIAMSHPDRFAGVVSINGISDKYCKWYWKNSKTLPMYVVCGELTRDSLERNSREMNRMMLRNFPVVYCEYVGRGYESFYEEIRRIFEWMEPQRRVKNLKEFEMQILRPTDNRFFWVEAHDLPNTVAQAAGVLTSGTGVRPLTMTVKVTPGNTMYVRSAAKRQTLWLNPDIVDFDKRLQVRFREHMRFNDFLKQSGEVMLDDFRLRGDRQQIFWAKVEVD